MNSKVKTSISALTIISAAILAGCSSKELPPIQGQWYQEHDGWSESLYIYEDNFGYIEESMDGLEFTGDYTKKTADGFEFIVEGKYPGTLVYDHSSKTVTVTVPGVLPDRADFSRTFSQENYFDALASYSEEAEDRVVYSDEAMTEKLTTAPAGEAYPIKAITDDWCEIRVPVDATGYVSVSRFLFSKYIPTSRIFDKNYERADSTGLISYSFCQKGDDVTVYCDHMQADASPALEYYFGGSIRGNVISVDRQIFGNDAFEKVDLSEAKRLDNPFEIYVMETPYETFLIIEGERYNQQTTL